MMRHCNAPSPSSFTVLRRKQSYQRLSASPPPPCCDTTFSCLTPACLMKSEGWAKRVAVRANTPDPEATRGVHRYAAPMSTTRKLDGFVPANQQLQHGRFSLKDALNLHGSRIQQQILAVRLLRNAWQRMWCRRLNTRRNTMRGRSSLPRPWASKKRLVD